MAVLFPNVNFKEPTGPVVSLVVVFESSLLSPSFEDDEKMGIREGSELTPEVAEKENVGRLSLSDDFMGSSMDRFFDAVLSLDGVKFPAEKGVRAGFGAVSLDGWGTVIENADDAGLHMLDPVAGFTFDELNAEPKLAPDSEDLIVLAAPNEKPKVGLLDGKSAFTADVFGGNVIDSVSAVFAFESDGRAVSVTVTGSVTCVWSASADEGCLKSAAGVITEVKLEL